MLVPFLQGCALLCPLEGVLRWSFLLEVLGSDINKSYPSGGYCFLPSTGFYTLLSSGVFRSMLIPLEG